MESSYNLFSSRFLHWVTGLSLSVLVLAVRDRTCISVSSSSFASCHEERQTEGHISWISNGDCNGIYYFEVFISPQAAQSSGFLPYILTGTSFLPASTHRTVFPGLDLFPPSIPVWFSELFEINAELRGGRMSSRMLISLLKSNSRRLFRA
jgi:hypothetical protein